VGQGASQGEVEVAKIQPEALEVPAPSQQAEVVARLALAVAPFVPAVALKVAAAGPLKV
jgi:hypothetical protein